MKKTLFKRGLASATGALLAVTQFGAMLGTVGAADPLVIDASYLTDVPVEIGVDGLNYTEGSWYNYLTLAYAAGEAVDSTVAMDGVKDAIKNQIGDFLKALIMGGNAALNQDISHCCKLHTQIPSLILNPS